MTPEHLTYQWLTPIMMGIITFLVGVIGMMIKNYLASIDKNIEQVKDDLVLHVNKVESFIKETNDRYFLADKRISILEDQSR